VVAQRDILTDCFLNANRAFVWLYQSSAIVAECDALAEISTILGKADDAALLRRRQKELGDLINARMFVCQQ
jgi:hypothetical protein